MVEIDKLAPRVRPVQGRIEPTVESVSKDQLLLMQMAESMATEDTVEDLLLSDTAKAIGYEKQSPEHAVSLHHVRPGKIIMFKVDRENGRVIRRPVPSKRMLENLKDGWLATCPDCHTDCSPNPNECPTRVATRDFKLNTQCPVCNKTFYDPGAIKKRAANAADPGSIDFEDYNDSPQTRLKSMRDDHIRAWHPTIGRRMGLFGAVEGVKVAAAQENT